MYTRCLLSWLLAILATLCLVQTEVRAQVNPFRGGPGLSPEDNRLLFDSIARLNAVEPAHVGLSETWSNPHTNISGTSTILRVFPSGGTVCHLVEHRLVNPTRPPPVSYRLTWCRAPNGEWKIRG